MQRVRLDRRGPIAIATIDSPPVSALSAPLRAALKAAADGADIVIEAAFEEISVKHEIFGALDKVAKPGAILASKLKTRAA